MRELEITIDRVKIGKHKLSGEIYFVIGSSGTYCDLPSDDELLDYELYDENNELFEIDTDEMQEKILQTAIKLYRQENEYNESDSEDDWDEQYPSEDY